MLNHTSEQQMHRVRWLLTIGWLLIIFSLFYDPLTPWLTDPANTISPIRFDPTACVNVQGECLVEQPYAIGARLFWAAIVPAGIFILFVFGHEFWRRICPLGFLSQIPRALGWQRQRTKVNARTGKKRTELVKVDKNSWLAKNHLALQFGLFYLGLCTRLLFVNSDRFALGIFLLVTILASIYVGYLFGGKAWCQYFCPMAPVQKVYSEPRGLLNSSAHEGDRQKITQSMCRTVGQDSKEKPTCVACQAPCMDIDAERSYWELITRPDQRWLHYGYFGLTIGFYVYYYLYAGGWDYYFSGGWTHEEGQLATLLNPGFYLAGYAIPVPKLVAVPLTLGAFGLSSYWIGEQLEKRLKAHFLKQKKPMSIELIRHKMFTLCTFLVFNVFFIWGARPNLRLLPISIQYLFTVTIAVISGLWLYRTWQRTPSLYQREGLASRLRKQLRKLNLDVSKFLEGRSLDDLTADEVYVLAKVVPDFSQEKRLQTYKGMLKEAIEDGYVEPASSLTNFQQMRRELDISDQEHEAILTALSQEYPDLFDSSKQRSRENSLRLDSYRDSLLETILSSWQTHPDQARVADLMKAFSEKASNEVIEGILADLSQADRAIVQDIREEYGITAADEADALKQTEPEQLWQVMADHIGLLGYLNPESGNQLHQIFEQIDADGSGYISLAELRVYIQAIEPNFTTERVEAILKRADTSGDEQVSYEEFQAVFKFLVAQTGLLDYLKTGADEQLHQVFEQIDADGSGYISLAELQVYIQTIDPNFTTAQVEAMLKRADTSGDAQINYEEFQTVFKSLLS